MEPAGGDHIGESGIHDLMVVHWYWRVSVLRCAIPELSICIEPPAPSSIDSVDARVIPTGGHRQGVGDTGNDSRGGLLIFVPTPS
jgi:hypothetical protein